MYNIQDWCISRQIWWGHRLPVWYCKECFKNEDAEGKTGIIVAKEKPQKCPNCGSHDLAQDEDVLDTGFLPGSGRLLRSIGRISGKIQTTKMI
jgi:valyl-tRNA synthetase